MHVCGAVRCGSVPPSARIWRSTIGHKPELRGCILFVSYWSPLVMEFYKALRLLYWRRYLLLERGGLSGAVLPANFPACAFVCDTTFDEKLRECKLHELKI